MWDPGVAEMIMYFLLTHSSRCDSVITTVIFTILFDFKLKMSSSSAGCVEVRAH